MRANRIFGYYRDNLIAETVEKYRCLTTEQLRLMFFKDVSLRQCQHVLKRVTDKKHLIKRWRMDLDQPYYYFTDKLEQKEHISLLNWLYFWYVLNSKYETIKYFDYQKDYEILKPDLLLVTYNNFRKEEKTIFFEMDNSVSNEFDKVIKYNKLFEDKVDKFRITVNEFPIIYIATTNVNRLKHISKLIETQNVNSLTFRPYLIWDLKEEMTNENFKGDWTKFILHNDLQSASLCTR